jgi:hypothetical protein
MTARIVAGFDAGIAAGIKKNGAPTWRLIASRMPARARRSLRRTPFRPRR